MARYEDPLERNNNTGTNKLPGNSSFKAGYHVSDLGEYGQDTYGSQQAKDYYLHQRQAVDQRQAAQLDPDAYAAVRSAADGTAPSQAEILAKRAGEDAVQGGMSMASSTRGGPGAQLAAMRAAQMNAGRQAAQAAQAGAAARAGEMTAARGQFLNAAQSNLNAQQNQTQMNDARAMSLEGQRQAVDKAQLEARLRKEEMDMQARQAADQQNRQTAQNNASNNKSWADAAIGALGGIAKGIFSDERAKTNVQGLDELGSSLARHEGPRAGAAQATSDATDYATKGGGIDVMGTFEKQNAELNQMRTDPTGGMMMRSDENAKQHIYSPGETKQNVTTPARARMQARARGLVRQDPFAEPPLAAGYQNDMFRSNGPDATERLHTAIEQRIQAESAKPLAFRDDAILEPRRYDTGTASGTFEDVPTPSDGIDRSKGLAARRRGQAGSVITGGEADYRERLRGTGAIRDADTPAPGTADYEKAMGADGKKPLGDNRSRQVAGEPLVIDGSKDEKDAQEKKPGRFDALFDTLATRSDERTKSHIYSPGETKKNVKPATKKTQQELDDEEIAKFMGPKKEGTIGFDNRGKSDEELAAQAKEDRNKVAYEAAEFQRRQRDEAAAAEKRRLRADYDAQRARANPLVRWAIPERTDDELVAKAREIEAEKRNPGLLMRATRAAAESRKDAAKHPEKYMGHWINKLPHFSLNLRPGVRPRDAAQDAERSGAGGDVEGAAQPAMGHDLSALRTLKAAPDGSITATMPVVTPIGGPTYSDLGKEVHQTAEGRGFTKDVPITAASKAPKSTADGGSEAGAGEEERAAKRVRSRTSQAAAPRKRTPEELSRDADAILKTPDTWGSASGIYTDGMVRSDDDARSYSDERSKEHVTDTAMADANRAMKPRVYEYKAKYAELEGQQPGEKNVGPMAQDMAKDPIARMALTTAPDGLMAIDKSKGLKLVMGGLADLQKQVDELAKRKARRA